MTEPRNLRAQLALILLAIEENDLNYPLRYSLVLDALALAVQLGYTAGIGYDEKEGPDWPVVYLDLPGAGQVSWHLPSYRFPWDGHTTEEKYRRIHAYVES